MKNMIKIVAAVLVVCAFTVSACAAGFVGSVEQKEVPAVVVTEKTVAPTQVTVTPAANEEASEAAAAAYEALVELGSAEAVDESLAGGVITDVFEVAFADEIMAQLEAGEKAAVAVELEVEEGQTVKVLFFEDPEWVVVDDEQVSYEDGVLTIEMTKVGVYAIVVL